MLAPPTAPAVQESWDSVQNCSRVGQRNFLGGSFTPQLHRNSQRARQTVTESETADCRSTAQWPGWGWPGDGLWVEPVQWGPAAAYCAAAVQWVVIRDRAARSQSRWSAAAAAALNWLIDSLLCYYDVSQSRLSSYRISSTNVTPFKHFNSLHHNTRNYVFTEHSQYPNFIKTTDWIRYEWLKPPGVFTAV